ncbi:TRAM1-like protein & [Coniochaeta sp. 2T2.1]|nr:TRAM1-like protein & [Coniochaeta sp. 2T2.1]
MGDHFTTVVNGKFSNGSVEVLDKLATTPARPAAQTLRASTDEPRPGRLRRTAAPPSTVKRKEDGFVNDCTRWLFENQTSISFHLIATLLAAHKWFDSPTTARFLKLAYYNPSTGKYGAGVDDYFFMTFCVVVFTGLRAGAMEYVLAPLGKRWGIAKKKDTTRFAEQAWLWLYCCMIWPAGMYIYVKSPYFLNMSELWTNWPDRELTGLMKTYILVQWSFWVQQVLVIHLEDRRKDHWQMLTHHFVTISLVAASYYNHMTRVGHLILVLMDVVDLFFPLAKCLKYLGFGKICDVMFGLFMLTWFVARHVFYLMTCWSIYADTPRIIGDECYRGGMNDLEGPLPIPTEGWAHVFDQFYNPKGYVCFGRNARNTFLSALLFLQLITIVWFGMIVRVAMKVLKGGAAEDTRSDDEGECDEEEEDIDDDDQPLEVEAGVEDIDLKAWERRTGVNKTKRTGTSTGISLPGHSDRKEFLNRIGCENKIDWPASE